eukprot:11124724-Heterocapsa_arctica.AAC.1
MDLLLRAVADRFDLSVSADMGWRWFNMFVVASMSLQMMAHHVWKGQRSHSNFRVFVSCLSSI